MGQWFPCEMTDDRAIIRGTRRHGFHGASLTGWSVRGSTRGALDSIDGTVRSRLIANLQRFGRFWFVKKGGGPTVEVAKKSVVSQGKMVI